MDNRAVLKNDCLSVEISADGAELKSIKVYGEERLWQPDPQWWEGQSPLLFPICGRLTDNKYLYNGKLYEMKPHGFAKEKVFEIESVEDAKAVFLLKSDEDTKEIYPFDFELRVIYSIDKNSLSVTYVVNNKTDGKMYFSIGSHEAYICKGSIEDYELYFEKGEPLVNYLLDGPLLNGKTEPKETRNGALSFCDEEFKALDTLLFLNTESKNVTLSGKNTKNTVTVDFTGTDHLLIWKEPGAEFLCLEPWCGLPDYVGEVKELSQKPGINKLEKDEVFEKTHIITFN